MKPLLIDAATTSHILGISRSFLYLLKDNKQMPAPIRLASDKSTRRARALWQLETLELWVRLNCPDQKKFKILESEERSKRSKRCVKALTNAYIKQLLCDSTDLKSKDIPIELVVAKREHIKLRRLLKGIKE